MTISDLSSYDHAHQLSINLTADDWTVMEDRDASFQQCSGQWKPAHHGVYHVAHSLLLVSFLIPARTHRTLAAMHLMLVAGKNCSLVNALCTVKLKFHWHQFLRNFLADLLATSPTSP